MNAKPKADRAIFKLRGLPFSAREAEITSFLHDVDLKEIHMVFKSDGQLTGEAFVVTNISEDARIVLAHDGELIGRRFIEVHRSCQEQLDWYLRRSIKPDGTVRLIGLPYDVTRTDLMEFFSGLEIVPNGIGILVDGHGTPTGEAYVQFVSPEIAKLATEKHNEVISGRYVEIYPCNLVAANQAVQRQMYKNMGTYPPEQKKPSDRFWFNPYWLDKGRRKNNDTNGTPSSQIIPSTGAKYQKRTGLREIENKNHGYQVRMRGLPFEATVDDILNFFHPLQPLRLYLRSRKDGRPDGTADVYFENLDDAEKAMMRQGAIMGFRYIELFNKFNQCTNNTA